MFSKTLLGLSSLLAVGSAAVAPLELRQNDICLPGQGVTTVYVTNDVIVYPVVVNQYFESNTIINIGGITININNAPTSISTVFTATTTASTTVTATQTVEVTATATPFVLVTEPIGAAKKRQVGSTFIGPAGTTANSCSSAEVFTIEFGQLKSNGDFLSTDITLEERTFTVSPTVGDISTTFSINAAGHLVWSNGNFTGGSALFSLVGSLNVISFDGSYPTGSTGLNLVYLPASECSSNGTAAASSSAAASSAAASSSAAVSSASSSSFNTSSIATSTSVSVSVSVSTATPSATASAFSLSVNTAGAKHKRQALTYVGAGGVLTTDPTDAETFFLTGAKLYTGEGEISINSTSSTTVFAGSLFPGDITTSFISGASLAFVNSTFPSGQATFCTQANTLFIVLDNQPTGCTTVQLVPQSANPTASSSSITSTSFSTSLPTLSSSSFSFFPNSTVSSAAITSAAAAVSSDLAALSSDAAALSTLV